MVPRQGRPDGRIVRPTPRHAPSGGHETRSLVEAFLDQRPFCLERETLMAFLGKNRLEGEPHIGDDGQAPSLRLAEEYLRRKRCLGPTFRIRA